MRSRWCLVFVVWVCGLMGVVPSLSVECFVYLTWVSLSFGWRVGWFFACLCIDCLDFLLVLGF